jgi:hypothetical protein
LPALDREDNEITPLTICRLGQKGCDMAKVHGHVQGHQAVISTDRLPSDLSLSEIVLRLYRSI